MRTIRSELLALCLLFLFAGCVTKQERMTIEGSSMEPNFPEGTVMRLQEVDVTELNRGDPIVFEFPLDPDQILIRRLIGLPGDTVQLTPQGVLVDGHLIEEPYDVVPFEYESQNYVLGEGEYFVLGDNRPNGSDSTDWGAVDAHFIQGRAIPVDP